MASPACTRRLRGSSRQPPRWRCGRRAALLADWRSGTVANQGEDQASRLGGEGRVLDELPAVQRPSVEDAALVARGDAADDRARFVERRSPVALAADVEERRVQGGRAGFVDSKARPEPRAGEADDAGQRQGPAVFGWGGGPPRGGP